MISWLIAFAGLGLLFGTLATSIGDIVADNPSMAQVLASGAATPADLTFAFLVTILQILAIIAAVMGVQVVLRIYSEEVDYRVEPLLAGSLRRQTAWPATPSSPSSARRSPCSSPARRLD
jgi:ABC-2 type transport system permease protein